MQFELASNEHKYVFETWSQFGRLEERTCRPILNGKRVSPNSEVVTFSFTMDGIEELVGRFSYFDFNPRNHSAECRKGYLHPVSATVRLLTKIWVFSRSHPSSLNLNLSASV